MAGIAATRPPLDLNMQGEMQGGTRLDAQILRLPAGHQPVDALPGYAEGQFFVQDIAASYPARLLGDVAGKRVLDSLCSTRRQSHAAYTKRGACHSARPLAHAVANVARKPSAGLAAL